VERPPFEITLVRSPGNAWDHAVRAGLPARPGLVSIEADGACVQLGATGDLRAFAERRLIGASGPATDLSSVSDRVRAVVLGSAFEADIAFLEWGRELIPESYRAAADRWRGWFLRLDPESDVPVWRKTNLSEAVKDDRADRAWSPSTIIGPMPTKDSAAKFGRALDSEFELCREPKLLAQRPDATACSYKEMGRCPAPCDGSEPIEAYRDRVRDAIAMASSGPEAGVDARLAAVEEAMARAAASLHFEQAAELKVRGEALKTLAGRSFRKVTTLDRFAAVLVLPSTRRGWCRVLTHVRGRTAWWADVDAQSVKAAVEQVGAELGPELGLRAPQAGDWLNRAAVERIGLVCHAAAHPPRGPGRVIPVLGDSGPSNQAWSSIVRVMRAVCRADVSETGSGDTEPEAIGER